MPKPLREYARMRNFRKTPEPGAVVPRVKGKSKALLFVVQEHHASHLHYDFRLEWNGVLRSWAVPKGPSMVAGEKRLAVEVEDHPIAYAKFTGEIPAGEYGAGVVHRWDFGSWEPEGDVDESLRRGRLEFRLKGKKLKGSFLLVRTRAAAKKPQWLLIKRSDEQALKKFDVKEEGRVEETNESAAPSAGFIAPELATLVDEPPAGDDWIHEAKFDGYRIEAEVHGENTRLFTRSGADWTAAYPTVARELRRLKLEDAVLDGEVVWLEKNGHTDFQKLQNARGSGDQSAIAYFVFDLLRLHGKDLRLLPLAERKEKLAKLLRKAKKPVFLTEHFSGDAAKLLKISCRKGLEGLVSKRLDSRYLSGRHDDWAKSKCQLRQEFVIGGFTEEKGSRVGFGALLIGVSDPSLPKGKLRYAGKVGTGFTRASLLDLKQRLAELETEKSPFDDLRGGKGTHWVRPALVAEVKFAQWTQDRIVRAPVFQGLREDKPARQVVKEKPAKASVVTLTHPDKLYYVSEGITKGDLARYYAAVAKWMMPHIVGRPVSLVRCPEGTGEKCFFQRHLAERLPACVKLVEKYLYVEGLDGLRALVQRSTVELHSWNALAADLEHPDQIVMDFDPDPELPFTKVKQAAMELKEILDQLGLRSFLKTTGGKGLHVHVPFAPAYDWEQVKAFAETLARELESRDPALFTTTASLARRTGKIYIDHLRNRRGASAVAPYSLRAKERSAVAMPIGWDELADLPSSDHFTLGEALRKLSRRKKDPWEGFFRLKQRISILDGENTKRRKRGRKQ